MKDTFFENIKQKLVASQFRIESFDYSRPWGGFLVIDENQAQGFAKALFDGLDVSSLKI